MISASREILTSLAAHPDIRPAPGCRVSPRLATCDRRTRSIRGRDGRERGGRRDLRLGADAQVVKVDDRAWFRDIMGGDGFVVSD